VSSPTEPEAPSSPAKPGQGAEPTPGDPGSALPDLRDPGSNSHKPETRIGKLTYELRKTEIAAEIRKEEIRAELRKAELAEQGDDKENERNTQVLLDKQRNRVVLFGSLGLGLIFVFALGTWLGRDTFGELFGFLKFGSGGAAEQTKTADRPAKE
jgi:hypothetical protein